MRAISHILVRGIGLSVCLCFLSLASLGQEAKYGLTGGLQVPFGRMGDYFAVGLGLDVRYDYVASEELSLRAGIGAYRFLGNWRYDALTMSTIPAYLGAEYRFFRKALGNSGLNLIMSGGLDGGIFVSGGNAASGTYSSQIGLLVAPRYACILELSGLELFAELRPLFALPLGHAYLGLNLGLML